MTAYLALGSNLGDRSAHLAEARARLAALPDTHLLAESAVEETEPLGGREQPRYLNQVVALATGLPPRRLLDACLAIEAEAGRVRSGTDRWASRSLDIDILRYGDRTVDEPGLVIPHPALAARDFWRRELADVERRLS